MQKLSDSKHLRLASKHLCLCWTLLASLLQDCSREWVERTCSWDKRYQRIELGLTRIDWLILLDDARHCKARSIPNMYQCTACRSLPWQILDGLRGILRRFQMVKAFCQVAEFAWNSWPVISKMSPDVSRCLQYFTASTLTTRTDSSKWAPPFADSGYTLFCCSHQTEPAPAAGFTYS